MQLSITVNGELVRKGLENLSAEIPEIGTRQIYDTINRITRRMEAYPPERPGQRYVRTGRFGFSWYVDKLGNGYRIKNNAVDKYGRTFGKYVVGDAYGKSQAWMHVGRWQVFRDVADEEIEKLPPDISKEIVTVARRYNLDAKQT